MKAYFDNKQAEIINTMVYPAPCNFSVELDSDCNNGLMVFASKLRKIEKGAYDNIITVERGRHFAGEIEVTEDNTLIYFEDGAYADGKITAKN